MGILLSFLEVIASFILLLFALKFLVPKKIYSYSLQDVSSLVYKYRVAIIPLFVVQLVQIFEVLVLDEIATGWIASRMGKDYFTQIFFSIEGDIVSAIALWTHDGSSSLFHDGLFYFFIGVYLLLYPFLIWFIPVYFILEDSRASRMGLYIFPAMYLMQLPFLLFFPVTNFYTYLGLDFAFDHISSQFGTSYYMVTTVNNCFPSLHVAIPFAVMFVSFKSPNKKLKWFTVPSAILITISTMYLAIHWVIDVIGGILLAICGFVLLNWIFGKRES